MVDKTPQDSPWQDRGKVVVLGVGNVLLKDEGIGVHVARALQEMIPDRRSELEIIDGGTSPDAFLLLNGVHKLIIVDAIKAGGTPGKVYRFHHDDIRSSDSISLSVHQVGVLDSLQMMAVSGSQPEEVVIIGIEPAEIGWGLELSASLSRRMPQIIKVVVDEIGAKSI